MSGIAAVLNFTNRFDAKELVHKVTLAMQHRGPDGLSFWAGNFMAMGHCHLNPMTGSQARCPSRLHDDNDWALSWDGRLDNRDELYHQLNPRSDLVTVSDAALVLAAYRRWGKACAERFLGDFAFALWDPALKIMFCVRDPVGARPLCFVRNEHFFACASEPEALLQLPGVGTDPNEVDIASLFDSSLEWLEDRRSWNRHVETVLEGEYLQIGSDSTCQISNYWRPSTPGNETFNSVGEAGEAFAEVFGRAVADRLHGVEAPAMMLSGGLDSAGIACWAQVCSWQNLGKRMHAYSAIDDDLTGCVESRSILSMVHQLDLELHHVAVPSFTGMVSVEDVYNAAWQHAHPVDNALLLPAMMALAASRNGHRYLLHGASGDLATATPAYYPGELIRRGCWLRALRECQAASRNHVYLNGTSPGLILCRSLVQTFVPQAVIKFRNDWLSRGSDEVGIAIRINPDLVRKVKHRGPRAEQTSPSAHSRGTTAMQASLSNTLGAVRSGLSGFNRVASRYGVEVSDPWADTRVLQWLAKLPLEYKVRDGWTKYLLRSQLHSKLPGEVVWRRDKIHLGWKFAARLMAEAKPKWQSILLDEPDLIGQYVQAWDVRSMFEHFEKTADVDLQDELFRLATLALWIKSLELRPAQVRVSHI